MTVRVTVEPAKTPRRVQLRAVASDGHTVIVDNIPREDATRQRNQLVELLVASGKYDEVIGEPIEDFPDPPWVRRPGDPDRP